ncbi:MAG TPA: prepilin-type N-terminal cleavage/methylation domain-containing protein [Bryobacteraceae bacterium]|nr:prepilin-type N-terminal cleavage/methylation domain-containing protein [Bryobacteraceae bacterium]
MKHRSTRQTGVTLVEMIVVLALVGFIAALAFPAVTSGLDSIRLTSASDSVVSFLNAGLNRAERRQVPVEIIVSIPENKLKLFSVDTTRELNMPEQIRIVRIHPVLPSGEDEERSFVLYPGGAVPRLGVEIVSERGFRRIVRVDPITGIPQVEQPPREDTK